MGDQAQNGWLSDYQSVEHVGPDEDMTPKIYASFLEGRGVTAMVIVDRLREEFNLTVAEAWGVVRRSIQPHGRAFLREVELIEGLRGYPDDHALARKVASNIGIEMPEALDLVQEYRAKKS